MKKIICFNLSPVSPAVRAWYVDLNVVELDDDPAKEPVRYPCTYSDFLSIVSEKFPDVDGFSVLRERSTLPGGAVAGSLLHYWGVAPLIKALESLCLTEVMPDGRGGFLVKAELTIDDDSFFKALTRG